MKIMKLYMYHVTHCKTIYVLLCHINQIKSILGNKSLGKPQKNYFRSNPPPPSSIVVQGYIIVYIKNFIFIPFFTFLLFHIPLFNFFPCTFFFHFSPRWHPHSYPHYQNIYPWVIMYGIIMPKKSCQSYAVIML